MGRLVNPAGGVGKIKNPLGRPLGELEMRRARRLKRLFKAI